MKTKQSLRQQYIESIMKHKYIDDDPNYDDINLAFLEALGLSELAQIVDDKSEDNTDFKSELDDEYVNGEDEQYDNGYLS